MLGKKKYKQILKEHEKERQNKPLNNRSFKEYRKLGTGGINKCIKNIFSPGKKN